jgi:hypothetical protein
MTREFVDEAIKVGNKFSHGVFFYRNRITKHASHDQSSHGNWARGGSVDYPRTGDILNDGSPRYDGERRTEAHPPIPDRLGDCYLNAGQIIMDDDATLIHGVITSDQYGDVAHAWVELDDGYIYEPSTDAVYHPEDFEKIHAPVELKRYEGEEARIEMISNEHWGPWDMASQHWYEVYHDERPGSDHRTASHLATAEARELVE